MEHYSFLFYLVSFSTGILSIGISTGIYLHFRREPLLYYILFLTSLSIIIISLSLTKYLGILRIPYFTRLFSPAEILGFLGFIMVMVILPRFLHSLIGSPYSKLKKILFPVLAVIQAAIILISGIYELKEKLIVYFSVPFISVFIYCLVFIGISLGKIGNRLLKKGIIIFFLLSLIYFPLNITEMIRERYHILNAYQNFEVFTLPLYFFLLNLFSIIFAVFYFNQPAYIDKGKVTDFFRRSYGISGRESEIISSIISGMKNEEIAERLFISTKTVNNHIYNIFQKTRVKNRVQLVNLLITNRKG
jgi:DNA-binding CsgD family transcriptional regulator